jgi:NTP pyrophosphatase (non-canonical NTP hydrolase)
MSNKTFQEIIDRSLEVINEFKKVEKKPWGAEGAIIELMKQVGELSKLVMVTEGYYMAGRDNSPEYQSSKEKIGDELSDILLMTIRLADHYGINLEETHLKELDIAMNHPLMKIKPENK